MKLKTIIDILPINQHVIVREDRKDVVYEGAAVHVYSKKFPKHFRSRSVLGLHASENKIRIDISKEPTFERSENG